MLQRYANENPFAGVQGRKHIHKYGQSATFSSGDCPVDVYSWDGGPGTLYPYPTAGLTTTIRSTSDQDQAGGTGVQSVFYQGLTREGLWVEKSVDLLGTTVVTLPDKLFRAFRIACTGQVGANGANVGDIQIRHGSSILAQVDAGKGQTLMAIFTTPKMVKIDPTSRALSNGGDAIVVPVTKVAYFQHEGAVHKATATYADFTLLTRDVDGIIGAWRVREDFEAISVGTSHTVMTFPIPLDFGTLVDIRLSIEETNGNNIHVVGAFDLIFYW